MKKVTIVIPNYNGEKYIDECFSALTKQSYKDFDVILADNGSEDNSISKACQYKDKLDLNIKKLNCNYGFAKAVNEGIRQSQAEYVILLNNDTHAGRHFVENLLKAIEMEKDVFAAQALMLQYNSPELVDSAGDYFCALGVAFSAGKDKKASLYKKKKDIFSACAGAAIYRRKIFEEIGYFEEEFFAYLEDVDICYRAKLFGYRNIFVPDAKVLHVGSASSGSRYNEFKVSLAARNSMLLMYKNFAPWQWAVNFIPVLAGITIKAVFLLKRNCLRHILVALCLPLRKWDVWKKHILTAEDLNTKRLRKNFYLIY